MSGVAENFECACGEADCHWCVTDETRPTMPRPEVFEWDDVRVRVEWETESDEERPSVYQYRDGRDGDRATCPHCGEAWLHTRRTNAAGVDFIAFQKQEVTVERNQLVCGLCHEVIA